MPISVPPASTESRPRRGSRAPFVALVLALAAVGLVALVLLNTAVNENAFRLHDLETRQASLDDDEERLQRSLADEDQPSELEEKARRMGLVPAGDPGFVVLPKGRVVGDAVPAPTPSPSVTPGAGRSPSASPSAPSSSGPAPSGTVAPR